MPHIPQDEGVPEQNGASEFPPPAAPAMLEAKVENFLARRVELHLGQGVPVQLDERTRTSESAPQASQWNS